MYEKLAIDDKLLNDRAIQSEISNVKKTQMLEPEQYAVRAKGDFRKKKYHQYTHYIKKRLKENNAIDFDDIINYIPIKILMENPDVLEYYSNKFKYVS